jgi:hypothetical protein
LLNFNVEAMADGIIRMPDRAEQQPIRDVFDDPELRLR